MKINQLFENNKINDDVFLEEPIYHGSANYYEKGMHIPFRIREKPTHTSVVLHNEINKLAKDKFGLPIRSLFFCTKSSKEASFYGDLYSLVPVDDFRMFTSDYKDMTVELSVQDFRVASMVTSPLLKTNIDKDLGESISSKISSVMYGFKSETVDDLKKSIKEMLDNYIEDEVERKKLLSLIMGKCDEISSIAEKYVSEVNEVKTAEEYYRINQNNEIMIYCPKGFTIESSDNDYED